MAGQLGSGALHLALQLLSLYLALSYRPLYRSGAHRAGQIDTMKPASGISSHNDDYNGHYRGHPDDISLRASCGSIAPRRWPAGRSGLDGSWWLRHLYRGSQLLMAAAVFASRPSQRIGSPSGGHNCATLKLAPSDSRGGGGRRQNRWSLF